MNRDINIGLYKTFITVAEENGVTAAAIKLNLTQAAVSQQIRKLEEKFDCQLFRRDRKNFKLTPSGHKLLPKALEITRLSNDIWTSMTEPSISREIRLAAPTDIVNMYLPTALKNFTYDFPNVEINLVCYTSPKILEKWQNNEFDIAIIEEPAQHNDIKSKYECLHIDRLVWVGAKNGTAVTRAPMPISLSNHSNALRPAMLRALKRNNINYRIVSEVGTIETISATVRTDLAITALLQSTVPIDAMILHEKYNLPQLPHFEIKLLVDKEKTQDPFIDALCDKIRAVFSRHHIR